MSDDELDLKQIRRLEQQERKHRAILDAAFGMVEDEGLERLTMPRLAKALGVAVGGLYRTFPSKDRMVTELQGRAIDRLWRRVDNRWRRVDRPPADEAVRALAHVVVALQMGLRFASTDPVHHGLLVHLWAHPPSDEDGAWLGERAGPMVQAMLTRLRAAIDAQMIEPLDPNPTLAWWWTSLIAAQTLPEPIRPNADAILDNLLRGVGTPGFQLLAARRLIERADVSGPGGPVGDS
ncbi:MAG: TetR/AcrR family transcriptional regulator [Myxococcota bacterium]